MLQELPDLGRAVAGLAGLHGVRLEGSEQIRVRALEELDGALEAQATAADPAQRARWSLLVVDQGEGDVWQLLCEGLTHLTELRLIRGVGGAEPPVKTMRTIEDRLRNTLRGST